MTAIAGAFIDLLPMGGTRDLTPDERVEVTDVLDAASDWAAHRLPWQDAARVGTILCHGRPSAPYTRKNPMESTILGRDMVQLDQRNTEWPGGVGAPRTVTLERLLPMFPKDTSSEIPYGYCHCGCGEKTNLAKKSDSTCGYVKGEPYRYLPNHHTNQPAPHIRHLADGSVCIAIGHGLEAVVDAEDLPRLLQHRWSPHRGKYTMYASSSRGVLMHRFILDARKGELIDHADRNGLNNCKANLRSCGHSENQQNRRMDRRNTSGYKGVSWRKDHNIWVAYISQNGRRFSLGEFADPLKAARAYDRAALKMFGKYALTNEELGLLNRKES